MTDLFTWRPQLDPARAFDGKTYHAPRDYARLTGQLARVFALMRDGQWRTLPEIARHVQGSQPAVSARLRDLRKPKYGEHKVEKRYVRKGLWEYRVTVNRSES